MHGGIEINPCELKAPGLNISRPKLYLIRGVRQRHVVVGSDWPQVFLMSPTILPTATNLLMWG